ncbi:hypothetical protein CKA55_00915 [Arcobacter suis]|uniref:Membrane protein n=1 Tax=Arcobacter suis CECT 7833 TaxID=663365 RepID=A0AAD0SPN3_9BACT|nr:hypothetical protein [Arcobacter suis]AXX89077.1 putative membrane protein [Arcobacter suis CECT 7833]RWS47919.1 hypothetical protein CKA55_00915 [Arcobacter suis]
MGFKKYFIFSIMLIVAIFGYAYSLELGEYNVSFFGYSLTLPVAAWLIVPISFLALATFLHILWYAMLNYFKHRAVIKDHETMIKMIKSSLLEKNEIFKFKTLEFKNLSSILSQLKIDVKENRFSCLDEELNKIVANVQDVKDGKYVSDKTFKVNETTSLANLNMLNKVNEQIDFAVDVLKKPESFSSNVVIQSFENVLEEKSMTTIKKLYKNIKLDKEMAKKLFEKDVANNEFGFTSEELLKIVKDLNYDKNDYLALAKNYETILKPDQIIALFEKLSLELEEAIPAYLHVLFEYEMIDKAREVLANTKDNEYSAFKALLDLKEVGKHYNLEAISYK